MKKEDILNLFDKIRGDRSRRNNTPKSMQHNDMGLKDN
jgi:hypothetical protein